MYQYEIKVVDGDREVFHGRVAKRYSELVSLSDALLPYRRDPAIAAGLPQLNLDSTVGKNKREVVESRRLLLAQFFRAVLASRVLWPDPTLQTFLRTDSILLHTLAPPFAARVCGSHTDADGNRVYDVQVMPRLHAQIIDVLRPATAVLGAGEVLRVSVGPESYDCTIPPNVPIGSTFRSIVPGQGCDQHCWQVEFRYSELLRVDEEHIQRFAELRTGQLLDRSSSVFKGNDKIVLSRHCCIQNFLAEVAMDEKSRRSADLCSLLQLQKLSAELPPEPESCRSPTQAGATAGAANLSAAGYMALFLRRFSLAGQTLPSVLSQPTVDCEVNRETSASARSSGLPRWIADATSVRRIGFYDVYPLEESQNSEVDDIELHIEVPGAHGAGPPWETVEIFSYVAPDSPNRWRLMPGSPHDPAGSIRLVLSRSTAPVYSLDLIVNVRAGLFERLAQDADSRPGEFFANSANQPSLVAGPWQTRRFCDGDGLAGSVSTISEQLAAAEVRLAHWAPWLAAEKVFESGDQLPDVVAETAGSKSVAVGAAIGLAIPLPGMVLLGAAAGGVAALPTLQSKISRHVADKASWSMRVAPIRDGSTLADLVLTRLVKGYEVEAYSFVRRNFELVAGGGGGGGGAGLGALRLVQRLKRPEGVVICEDELEIVLGRAGEGGIGSGGRMEDCRMRERRRVLLGRACIAESERFYRFEPAEPSDDPRGGGDAPVEQPLFLPL